ncbi:hypothetical protein [Alkalibaculum sporogenes]|uniref:hypothetical protein n=1 Tax=Alkalibaculum sporogenes TaxID=2655001 RepID=UPI00187B5AB9|nr:hypothetical protein [Alkalibaculum sporogenes]
MNKLYKLKHKTDGYRAMADDVRRNQSNEIIAVHIPLIGWKDAREFEIEEG